MKCAKCNAVLRENDELKWECNVCHQMCKANLAMLAQIQAQRNNGYTGTMVSCPFCGGVLDDGHETIHWDCMYCGERQTGDIKTFLRPEVMAQPEQAKTTQKSAEEAGLMWEGGEEPEEVKDPRAERRARRERERQEREREREEREKKGFFADEEEKNRFLAESSIQTLGEEIPDSLFEDIPLRGKSTSAPETNASALGGQGAAPTGAAPTSTATPPKAPTAPANTAPTSAVTPPKAPTAPANTAPTSAATPPKAPTASASAAPTSTATPPKAPTAPASVAPTSAATPPKAPTAPASAAPTSAATPPRRPLGPKTASGPIPPSSTAFVSSESTPAPTGPDSDKVLENVSFERVEAPKKKQIWPKVITAIITILIVAALGVGIFVAVQYFLSPTRQFRNAIQKADYTTAEEIYNSKIKGNQEDERIAEIAVEHFLSEAFELYKHGASDGSNYSKLKDFAESILNMNTATYELVVATTPPEELEPSPSPSSEPAADVSASPIVSEEPLASATPAATEEVAATEEPEVTPEVTEEPAEPGTEPEEPADGDISAVLVQAKEYVRQKKYEKAYNYLASYKESDTSGQVKKEMAAVKKKWKSANIKEFKDLCAKLTIVYAAAEKRYHIVPKGYYTNYNQIARSNNVGGIAYMDQSKKKVSVTKIGKKGALTAYGKTNRAYLMKFKELIEKYPYLANEI